MVSQGVELSSFYTSPTCTPSRAQLMTGRYNFRTGMQDSVIHSTEPRGVSLDEKFLGQKLRDEGYATAHVGKWHLGMHMDQYTPLERGFDHHYGILTGGGGHYSHISVSQSFSPRQGGLTRTFSGLNLVEDGNIAKDNHSPKHSTELYSAKATEYVKAMSATGDPWFLYLAYQAIHDPIETDETWYTGNKCGDISEETHAAAIGGGDLDLDWDNRKILCGMVSQVDHGLGQLQSVLNHLGEWENTVVMFFSDNGGVATHGSVNYPFRGGKGDYWEGGVRVPAFISGGYVTAALESKGMAPYEYTHLTHITDVHATALALAGSPSGSFDGLDGVDLWDSLVATGEPARESVVININSQNFGSSSAVRLGNYKLIRNPEPSEALVYARVRLALAEEVLSVSEAVLTNITAQTLQRVHLSEGHMFLFDLEANPSEDTTGNCILPERCSNLYNSPSLEKERRQMEALLNAAQNEAMDTTFRWEDDGPLADPANFGAWVPWRDRDGNPLALYNGGEGVVEEGIGCGNDLAGFSAMNHPKAMHRLDEVVVVDVDVEETETEDLVGVYAVWSMPPTNLWIVALTVAGLMGTVATISYRLGRRSGYSRIIFSAGV
ncbi:unnamed protein product [Choristocarpus tenellus]